ncbi:class I adenylate-forming enzyme family protein [Bacillus sp. 3255]|uniref:class I adenylate-forming enzyme family protein n=1 Tax=Bacillus sp. 3255 TaxID=2817904 RepID=UPI002857C247|nr:class I adenylate-forming enzyme family protein [Bacillus sp. 3255]MDR6878652.1 fatty-acyl-CoA synthase [Bacillus sp. 3255]
MTDLSRLNPDTIAFFLRKRAMTCANDVAYSYPDLQQHYSWGRIWEEVQLIARGLLQLGVKKGDSVALLMTGRMELILSMFATACVGAIIVPLNTYSKKNELQAYLQSAKPMVIILGKEGHHLNYPSILTEIITDSQLSEDLTSWLPSHMFVMDGEDGISSPFRPFTDLIREGASVSVKDFFDVCRLATPNDPLILLYTSGTLGSPKGVLRTTASFLVSSPSVKKQKKISAVLQKLTDTIARHFSVINLLPLYHLGGFGVVFTNLKSCNIRIVMISHFHPLNAIVAIEQEACRILIGTPYMVQRMLSSAQGRLSSLSSLIGISFTSAAVSSSLLKQVNSKLRLLFFMVTYGSSESGSVANGTCFIGGHRNLLLFLLFKLLTRSHLLSGMIEFDKFEQNSYSLAGKVDRGVHIRIQHPETGEILPSHELGEVVVRSHRVMRYLNENQGNPVFTEDGWYKTGDLGYVDNHDHLTITGRLHRRISRGGEKISPHEIESLLLTISEVEDAFVLGIPDELYGERVCACIVKREGSAMTAQSVKESLSTHLSSFKVPEHIVFLPELPLSPTGKISLNDIKLLALHEVRGDVIHA